MRSNTKCSLFLLIVKDAVIPFLCISSKILSYFFKDGSSSTACLHQYWDGICTRGGMGRRSLDALTENIAMAKTPTTTPAMAVLRFHCGGLLHQPPDGDQTYCNNHRMQKVKNKMGKYSQKRATTTICEKWCHQ